MCLWGRFWQFYFFLVPFGKKSICPLIEVFFADFLAFQISAKNMADLEIFVKGPSFAF